MKNKKLTYLLLPFVAAVWAVIVYRFVTYTKADTPPAAAGPVKEIEKPAGEKTGLLLDYRDPFLEATKPARKAREESSAQREKVPEPPQMELRGVIKSGDRNYYAIISEGAGTILLGRGDTIGGYRITSIAADSVTVMKARHEFVLNIK